MARSQTISQQQHQSQIKSRTVIVCATFAVVYCLLIGRLGFLQVIRHSYYTKEEEAGVKNQKVLPAHRGIILDRNGDPLAINVPGIQVYADPCEIKDPATIPAIAEELSPILGRSVAAIEKSLGRKSHYVSLLRHAPTDTGTRVTGLQLAGAPLPGIHIDPDTMRAYPNDGLAAQVIGFTELDEKGSGDMRGAEGVEHSQDALLQGTNGLTVGEVDQKGRFIPGTIRRSVEPQNGHDITLTIDKNLQSVADSELAAAVKEHHAVRGVVVVMDPNTGEILALSNAPNYDPNHPRPSVLGKTPDQKAMALKACDLSWRDGAVSDLYEPGSTLKTITASAVLQEEGLQAEYHHVFCNGTYPVGKHIIHCAPDPPFYGHHGDEDLRGVLKESCNIGMALFGMKLGADKLYQYEQKFGFLDPPHSGLPGEARTQLQKPDERNRFTGGIGWSPIQLANISFGQGISVTPLQLATAYCAIANGGTLVQAHIVRAVSEGGRPRLCSPPPVRKVLTPEVAAEVRSILGTVVTDGTGKPAQIAGFSVGGKTGSAQVAGPRHYEAGHYVASFIGMVPLSHPRLVILCAVFEPQGVHWGAAVAAPVVHNVAKRAMLEMHILPDKPEAVDWDDHLSANHPHAEVTTVPVLLEHVANGLKKKSGI